ncbi:hypothetical protein [Shewanella youngdeokensis]|uniref:MarR family transcriptional regulator n=1 Tax=Shewanella youngdeokensis TaxID=2999068 RepID=A0ABZ0JTU7_9GAMM|nr:hypothetical protein RGE70_09365 [Shewanella sp. DAU334]
MDFTKLEHFIKASRYGSARTDEKKGIVNLLLLSGGSCTRGSIESQLNLSTSETEKAIDDLITANIINVAGNDDCYEIRAHLSR